MNKEEKIEAHTEVSMDAFDTGMLKGDYSKNLLQSKRKNEK